MKTTFDWAGGHPLAMWEDACPPPSEPSAEPLRFDAEKFRAAGYQGAEIVQHMLEQLDPQAQTPEDLLTEQTKACLQEVYDQNGGEEGRGYAAYIDVAALLLEAADRCRIDNDRFAEAFQRVREQLRQSARLPRARAARDIDFSQTPTYDFMVEELLPEGVTFLNAFAKIGKSQLELQLCLAVCMGQPFLGSATHACGTLYCALEDERADFEQRLQKSLRGRQPPSNFYYFTRDMFAGAPPILGEPEDSPRSLRALIAQTIREHPDIRLVCIDVFGAIQSEQERGMDFTQHERRDIQELLTLAQEFHLALVVAHHVGKNSARGMGAGADFMGSGAGSFVIGATVHSVWYLERDTEQEQRYCLSFRGRRIRSGKLALRHTFPQFHLEGDWNEVYFRSDPVVQTITYLVETYGTWCGTIPQLMKANLEESGGSLPIIVRKPKPKELGNLAAQLRTYGIGYRQRSNGNATLQHEFTRLENVR